MRNDERLRTIYEVMAPYIVRSERNWREYLTFASRFHKQSFDNILLVYAQDEDVTVLASKKQWASVGRNLISRPKGIAVCVYSNARLTLDYFFDTALHKALRSHNAKERVKDLLGQSETFKTINPDMTKAYTNAEWKIILGEDTYENMLDMLSKGKFFMMV